MALTGWLGCCCETSGTRFEPFEVHAPSDEAKPTASSAIRIFRIVTFLAREVPGKMYWYENPSRKPGALGPEAHGRPVEDGRAREMSMLASMPMNGFVPTSNPEKARGFYEGILGFELIDDNDFVATYRAGKNKIMLQKGATAPPVRPDDRRLGSYGHSHRRFRPDGARRRVLAVEHGMDKARRSRYLEQPRRPGCMV